MYFKYICGYLLLLVLIYLCVLSQNETIVENAKQTDDNVPKHSESSDCSHDSNSNQNCDNKQINSNNESSDNSSVNETETTPQVVITESTIVESDMPVVPAVATEVEMLSFEEWRKKIKSESKPVNVEPKQVPSVASNGQSSMTAKKSVPKRGRNFASYECGAKVVDANPEAESVLRILNEQTDEYMLNPCKAKVWFVIELCETIEPQNIELANFELYSSIPKEFTIHASDHYPTREWSFLGNFTAADERSLQRFEINTKGFIKFIKIEMLSHYGSEHFCPISVVRVFGTSLFDEVDRMDNVPNNNNDAGIEDELQSSVNEELVGDVISSQNLFGTARDAVLNIVRKAAQALNGNTNSDLGNVRNESHSSSRNTIELETSAIKLLPKLREPLFNCCAINKTDCIIVASKCAYIKSMLGINLFDTLCKQIIDYSVDEDNLKLHCDFEDNNVSQKVSIDNENFIEPSISTVTSKISSDNVFESQNISKSILTESSSVNSTISASQTQSIPSVDIEVNSSNEITIEATVSEQNKSDIIGAQQLTKQNEPQLSDNITTVTDNNTITDNNLDNTTQEQITNISQNGNAINGNGYVGVSVSGGQSKESVVIRLSNRIKALEDNLSLTSQYLEGLSQRYKKQMEEMQRAFNITINKLNDTTFRAIERDLKQQFTIGVIEGKLSAITEQMDLLYTEREKLNMHYIEIHIGLMMVEVIIVTAILYLCVHRMYARSKLMNVHNVHQSLSHLNSTQNANFSSHAKRVHPTTNHCHLPAKTIRLEGEEKEGNTRTLVIKNKSRKKKKLKRENEYALSNQNSYSTQTNGKQDNNEETWQLVDQKSHSTPTLANLTNNEFQNIKKLAVKRNSCNSDHISSDVSLVDTAYANNQIASQLSLNGVNNSNQDIRVNNGIIISDKKSTEKSNYSLKRLLKIDRK